MKIAIIGVKGVPVIYSGFETLAEELSTRLVKDKDFDVTVYCRSPYIKKGANEYKGVNLIVLPTIKTKNFETIIHSLISTVHACFFRKFDVIYYIGVGNALFTIFPRLIGIKTIINVDGFDWKREKWGSLAKSYLKLSSHMAMYFPNAVVTDSLAMKDYYQKQHKKKYYYIPYGYMDNFSGKNSSAVLKKYKLNKNKYFVWVGRIVPENHLEDLLSAYVKLNTDLKCVVIGDNFYHDSYTRRISEFKKNKNIIFTGFLNREKHSVLVKNAFAYIETKRSGGTHPSLVEAMGFGSLIISNDNITNRQLLGSNALYYSSDTDLHKRLEQMVSDDFKDKIALYESMVKKKAEEYFSWAKVVEECKQGFKIL